MAYQVRVNNGKPKSFWITLAVLAVLVIVAGAFLLFNQQSKNLQTLVGEVEGISEGSFMLETDEGLSFNVQVNDNTSFQFPDTSLTGAQAVSRLDFTSRVTVEADLQSSKRAVARNVSVQPRSADEMPSEVFNVTGTVVAQNDQLITVETSDLGEEMTRPSFRITDDTDLKGPTGDVIQGSDIGQDSRVLITTEENARNENIVEASSVRLLE